MIHAERGVYHKVDVLALKQLRVVVKRLHAQLAPYHVAALRVGVHRGHYLVHIGQHAQHMRMYIAPAAAIAYQRHSKLLHFAKASLI